MCFSLSCMLIVVDSAPKVPSSMPPKRSKKIHEKVDVAEIANVKVGNVTVSLIHGEIAKEQVLLMTYLKKLLINVQLCTFCILS